MEDYQELQESLDDLRAGQRVAAVYEEWLQDRVTARPYEEVRAELVSEGLLDE